jgi:hypothetical protein
VINPPPSRDVYDDRNRTFDHTLLEAEMANKIVKAVGEQGTVDTGNIGGGSVPFRETGPGGLVIGFELAAGSFGGNMTVARIRPVYLNDRGKGTIKWSHPPNGAVTRIEARPGYAVGGLKVRSGAGIDAVIVVFMKFDGQKLDPNDNYESPQYGGNGGAPPRGLGLDGSLIVGIYGRNNSATDYTVNNLGLITIRP